MALPASLAPSQIKVRKGFNVRNSNEVVDPDFQKSVATLGVLQAVIIEKEGDDYYLVAGHKRLAAAKKAKLAQIPVSLSEPTTDNARDPHREAVAAAENLARSDLNTVQEAMTVKRLLDAGFTDKGVQEVVGKSARWVTERKLILKVPEAWHELIAEGYVSAQERRALVGITEVSPQLADALLAWNKTQYEAGCRIDGWAIAQAAGRANGLWALEQGLDAGALKLDDEERHRIEALKKANFNLAWRPDFSEQELDRARAAGVLWEDDQGGGYRAYRVVTDTEVYRDLVLSALERAWKRHKRGERARSKAGSGRDYPDGIDEKEAERQLRERRKDARAKVQGLQARARDVNAKLGTTLLNGLASLELTDDIADLLVWTILRAPAPSAYSAEGGGAYSIAELAYGGVRYLLPDYQTDAKQQGKRSKREYASKDDAANKLRGWLEQAKTPREKIGRLVVAIAAAEFAIDGVVARSKRHPRARVIAGPKDRAIRALKRIVKPHLPHGLESCRNQLAAAERDLADLRRS